MIFCQLQQDRVIDDPAVLIGDQHVFALPYAMNANMVFKWLRDPRYTPEAGTVVDESPSGAACFLPVEIVDATRSDDAVPAVDPTPGPGTIEIDIAGGHRLRIVGAYDPETLARLVRGLSG